MFFPRPKLPSDSVTLVHDHKYCIFSRHHDCTGTTFANAFKPPHLLFFDVIYIYNLDDGHDNAR